MMGLVLTQTAAETADPVTWDVPAACPSQEELRGEVRRLLGGAEPDLSNTRIEGVVNASAEGYSLRLVVETPQGSTERRLDAPACDPLVDSAALYVAMAVDAVSTVATTREPVVVPEPDPGPVASPPAAQPPPRTRAFDLRVAGGASIAAYPQPGGFGSLSGSLRLTGVRLELSGTFTGWSPISLGDADAPAAAVLAGGAQLRVCPAVRTGSVELFGCGGIHIGLHRARGVAVDRVEVARQLSTDAVVGTGLAWWPRQRVGLWLEPDMVIGLYRPRFVVEGAAGSLTASAVSARVSLGVVVRLWEGVRG